jgi:hypothetical protein
MFGDRNRNVQSNQNRFHRDKSKSAMGIVYKLILDVDDDILKDLEIPEGIRTKYIGAIQFRLGDNPNKRNESLSIALPYNKTNVSLPTINETVRIVNSEGGGFTYERIIASPIPNINTGTNEITSAQQKEKAASSNTASDYSRVQSTGITKTSGASDDTDLEKYGDYFEPQVDIHKLKLYEGDYLIESRFGQSIRFSGYNNPENSFSPTLIFRNGESGQSLTSGIGNSTEEDVNRDGNIILLGSNQYQLPFQPGTVDDNGSSDFETTPQSFKDYPNDLKGNQILLNSDRLIFSAKSSEMIFYSKGNYGFISDGELSIDNKFGIRVNVNDDTNITTNDRNVNINSGNGKINLGDQNLESLVRGETLVNLLSQLVDAITQQIYITPAGPTSPGPTNVAVFQKIKSQLNTMLSDLNKTS